VYEHVCEKPPRLVAASRLVDQRTVLWNTGSHRGGHSSTGLIDGVADEHGQLKMGQQQLRYVDGWHRVINERN